MRISMKDKAWEDHLQITTQMQWKNAEIKQGVDDWHYSIYNKSAQTSWSPFVMDELTKKLVHLGFMLSIILNRKKNQARAELLMTNITAPNTIYASSIFCFPL